MANNLDVEFNLGELTQSLLAMGKEGRQAVIDGVSECTEMITQRQRELCPVDSIKQYITKGRIAISPKGTVGMSTGYQDDAFDRSYSKESPPGVIGLTFEFGRPGESDKGSSPTMKQVRNGKVVTVEKGSIDPVPHIRRGFDETAEHASDHLIQLFEQKTQ